MAGGGVGRFDQGGGTGAGGSPMAGPGGFGRSRRSSFTFGAKKKPPMNIKEKVKSLKDSVDQMLFFRKTKVAGFPKGKADLNFFGHMNPDTAAMGPAPIMGASTLDI